MFWDRLEECYGSPKVIESALTKRINSFPKISNKVKFYAILDEQSNRSLVRSEFFDIFRVQGPSSPYSLKQDLRRSDGDSGKKSQCLPGRIYGWASQFSAANTH